MQRAPCRRRCSSGGWVKISPKSWMRRSASRYGTARRGNSLKPVGLPMARNSMHGGLDFLVVLGSVAEHAFVIGGHDFDELSRDFWPLRQNFLGHHRAGVLAVQLDQVEQIGAVVRRGELFQLDDAEIAAANEIAGRVPDISDAAAHPRREVAASRTEDDDATACHVFAAVIADAFDHRVSAAIANGKTLGGAAAEKRLPAGRAIQGDVADDDVVFWL